jgi:hypothetical protein
MQWHIEQAAAAGATFEKVLETVYEKQFWTAHWLHLIRAQERQ